MRGSGRRWPKAHVDWVRYVIPRPPVPIGSRTVVVARMLMPIIPERDVAFLNRRVITSSRQKFTILRQSPGFVRRSVSVFRWKMVFAL